MSAALAVPLRSRCRRPSLEAALRGRCGGRTSPSSPRSSCYLPFSKHLHIATSFPNIWFRKLRAARRAAHAGPRGRGRDVRAADAPGPRLEGPARRVHVHRVRPLPGGLPGLEHREAAQSQDLHHGHPGHVGRGRARARPHPELADRPRHLRPRRHAAVGAAALARPDRRHRDPVRRGLGLRDLRRVRRGLPGPHRARRQDRRAAPEPRARGLALPAGADRRRSARWRARATRGASPRRRGSTGRSRSPFEVETVAAVAAAGRLDELEVLYWVGCAAAFDPRNQKVARAVATCLHAAGVRFAVLGQEESCTGDPARRMGNDYVFQILASGNVETLDRYGMGERTIVTACPHCFNTIGNEYGQLGGDYRIVHHSTYLAELLASGRLADRARGRDGVERRAPAGQRHRPRLVLSRPLQRRRGRARATCSVRPASRSPRWRSRDATRSAAAPAAAGCGWRRTAARASTPSARARCSRPAPTTVATACPFCMVMLSDGIAASAGAGTRGVDGHQRGPGRAARRRAGGPPAARALRFPRAGSARQVLPAVRAGRVRHEIARVARRAALHPLGAGRVEALVRPGRLDPLPAEHRERGDRSRPPPPP